MGVEYLLISVLYSVEPLETRLRKPFLELDAVARHRLVRAYYSMAPVWLQGVRRGASWAIKKLDAT